MWLVAILPARTDGERGEEEEPQTSFTFPVPSFSVRAEKGPQA